MLLGNAFGLRRVQKQSGEESSKRLFPTTVGNITVQNPYSSTDVV